jgi:hypothetical protein
VRIRNPNGARLIELADDARDAIRRGDGTMFDDISHVMRSEFPDIVFFWDTDRAGSTFRVRSLRYDKRLSANGPPTGSIPTHVLQIADIAEYVQTNGDIIVHKHRYRSTPYTIPGLDPCPHGLSRSTCDMPVCRAAWQAEKILNIPTDNMPTRLDAPWRF